MNQTLAAFARKKILEGLALLNEDCQKKFRMLYGINHLYECNEPVVASIPDKKLDWALTQVENTLKNPKMLK